MENKKIVVVGGVAGGASFAARMRRLDENAQIIMVEKGEYISFANCGLPYYIGETIAERENLILQTPESFYSRFSVDVRIKSTVISVDSAKKEVSIRGEDGEIYKESYDELVLSPGAKPLRPPIEGVDDSRIHTVRNIPDIDKIKSAVVDGGISKAVVVGGGFIGLEMVENLRHIGVDVSLVELSDQVFMPADSDIASILNQHLTMNGVKLYLSSGAQRFVAQDDYLKVELSSGQTLEAQMVILAIGVKPDTEFLKDSGIKLTDRGAIAVNESMECSAPNVYAVGDAVEVTDFITGEKTLVPLAGPANRQGRIVADRIAGIDSTYKSTQGTAICKVFDLTAAVTGINEKRAKSRGMEFIKSYTHSANHAGYYPGAFQMSIKILFSPVDRKLLGAQIIGKEGVDKRIDVFATAIRSGLTIDELTELELAYAPPYGSAKDPVNMAGFVAQNILSGRNPVIYAEEIAGLDINRSILLDVRDLEEFELGSIKGAVNIPLNNLRDSLDSLDSEKEIVIFCQVGLRGYIASSILLQKGYRVRNLSGGYKTYGHIFPDNYDSEYLRPIKKGSCSSSENSSVDTPKVVVDACGLQCPGPILKLKSSIDELKDGEILQIKSSDSGFAMDVPAWCTKTGNTLISLKHDKGFVIADIKKGRGSDPSCSLSGGSLDSKKTMVVFSNDFDRAMAAFIIANGAASMGSEVTLFFTFWGLNLLRKEGPVNVQKSFMESMFSKMMPRGATKTSLSKMNMGGFGTLLMQKEMRKKSVMTLPELMATAQKSGVRFVACTMSMDIMGIKKEELLDGVEYGGVGAYLGEADMSNYNLFI